MTLETYPVRATLRPRARTRGRFAAALLSASVLLAPLARADEGGDPVVEHEKGRSARDTDETRVVELRHLDTRAAVTLVRSIGQVRQIVDFPQMRTLVLRDQPRTVAQMVDLLRDVDVPLPDWAVEVRLVTDAGDRLLRRLGVEEESLSLVFGDPNSPIIGHVGVALHAEPYADNLLATYEIAVALPGDASAKPLRFSESGRASIADGDRLNVVGPALPKHRDALAATLGLDDEPREVYLRFRQID
jgi:hypothetical protein